MDLHAIWTAHGSGLFYSSWGRHICTADSFTIGLRLVVCCLRHVRVLKWGRPVVLVRRQTAGQTTVVGVLTLSYYARRPVVPCCVLPEVALPRPSAAVSSSSAAEFSPTHITSSCSTMKLSCDCNDHDICRARHYGDKASPRVWHPVLFG